MQPASPPATAHQVETPPVLPARPPRDQRDHRRVEGNQLEGNQTPRKPRRKLDYRYLRRILRKSTETDEIRIAATRLAYPTFLNAMQPASPPVTAHQVKTHPPTLPARPPRDQQYQPLQKFRTLRISTEADEIHIAATKLALSEDMKLAVVFPTSKNSSSPTLSLEQLPKAANGAPIIVESCLRYLEKNATDCVGLFLAPGSDDRVKQIWDYMQDHPCARLSTNCVSVFMREHKELTANDVAKFLKFLIKLIVDNESVITNNCYTPLVDLVTSKCPSHAMGEKCRRIIGQLLVPARRLLLGRLCNFLRVFCQHEAKTKMNCAKLAWCFHHLIQTPHEHYGKVSPRCAQLDPQSTRGLTSKHKKRKSATHELLFQKAENIKVCVSVIETLIKHSEHVFLQSLSPKCCSLVGSLPGK